MRQSDSSRFGWLMAFLLCLVSGLAWADEPVRLYAYHLKPPFIVDVEKRQGLYFEFADYANRKLGRTAFRTEFLPRKRLQILASQAEFNDAVIGVNPVWFKDVAQTRYLWSPTLMEDRDEVFSPLDAAIEYQGPESLVGKNIGLPSGYYYYGVDELVVAGKIRREDAGSEAQNLHKLAARRIDATIVSRSTFDYLRRHGLIHADFHVSARPHDEFARRILVARSRPQALAALSKVMAGMNDDPAWQAILAKYR